MVKWIVVMKIQPSICLDDWENHAKTWVRLVSTGIRTRDLPNASLVRYHRATLLGHFNFIFWSVGPQWQISRTTGSPRTIVWEMLSHIICYYNNWLLQWFGIFIILKENNLTHFSCDADIDECASNPCQHDGTCINLLGKFECNCTDEYMGTFCESFKIITCDNLPCMDGSTCKNTKSM